MGPRSRCANEDAPPAQPWQNPLPQRIEPLPDFALVRQIVRTILRSVGEATGLFTRLAWQCASSFRATDYLGGCNGARIRFSPQKDWPVNVNLDKALSLLEPIKEEFGPALAWADLIILAANTALELAGHISIPFCGVGRVDAEDGSGWQFLYPRVSGQSNETV